VTLDGGAEGLKAGLINPVAVLRTNTETHPLLLTEVTGANEIAARLLRFKLNLNLAAVAASAAEIEFSIPSVRDDARAFGRIAILAN
jgi:hypothetical protein